jgi:polysaccharide biosynthesis/export protein
MAQCENPLLVRILSALLPVALSLSWVTATAQQQPSTPAQPDAAVKESLMVGPGDLLHITIYDEPGLEQRARVNDAGQVSLSMIGSVKVAGETPVGAAQAIRSKYVAANLLNNPQVSVLVEEYATQTVSVLGQVNRPGAVQMVTPRSILDVIAMSGGLTATADRHVTVQRKGNIADRTTVFLPNDADATLKQNALQVYPGDTVVVPKAPIVYVLGDVAHPGGYPMENDSQITVLRSIALAGGSNKTASEGRARLIRQANGSYSEQSLHLKDMEKGKVADMQLLPNDVIYVPFSYTKNLVVGGSSIAASAASAIIYTHP